MDARRPTPSVRTTEKKEKTMSELRMPEYRLVVLAGRMGTSPELRRSSNDTPMCSLRLAVECYRGKEREKDTLWLDVD